MSTAERRSSKGNANLFFLSESSLSYIHFFELSSMYAIVVHIVMSLLLILN